MSKVIKCFSAWHAAEKKGYSGVGLYHRFLPSEVEVISGLGVPQFDAEGRVITLVHGDLAFVSAYFPNSQAAGQRLNYKLGFCSAMETHLKKLQKRGLNPILGGDINIAHQPLDLANPKQNEKNPGYLPEERDWMTHMIEMGFLDSFRQFHKDPGHYSWWSNRAGSRERNIGWRIDYHLVPEGLQSRLVSASIHPNVMGSDHCPVEVQLKLA